MAARAEVGKVAAARVEAGVEADLVVATWPAGVEKAGEGGGCGGEIQINIQTFPHPDTHFIQTVRKGDP